MVNGGENAREFHKPKLIRAQFREARTKEDDAIENETIDKTMGFYTHIRTHTIACRNRYISECCWPTGRNSGC